MIIAEAVKVPAAIEREIKEASAAQREDLEAELEMQQAFEAELRRHLDSLLLSREKTVDSLPLLQEKTAQLNDLAARAKKQSALLDEALARKDSW